MYLIVLDYRHLRDSVIYSINIFLEANMNKFLSKVAAQKYEVLPAKEEGM